MYAKCTAICRRLKRTMEDPECRYQKDWWLTRGDLIRWRRPKERLMTAGEPGMMQRNELLTNHPWHVLVRRCLRFEGLNRLVGGLEGRMSCCASIVRGKCGLPIWRYGDGTIKRRHCGPQLQQEWTRLETSYRVTVVALAVAVAVAVLGFGPELQEVGLCPPRNSKSWEVKYKERRRSQSSGGGRANKI